MASEAFQTFAQIAKVEKEHEARCLALLKNLQSGRVFKKGALIKWHCRNCGYVHDGKEAPEKCPVCSHPMAFFELLAENYWFQISDCRMTGDHPPCVVAVSPGFYCPGQGKNNREMDSSNLDPPSFFRYTKLHFQVKEYWSTRSNAERRKRFEARLNRGRYAHFRISIILQLRSRMTLIRSQDSSPWLLFLRARVMRRVRSLPSAEKTSLPHKVFLET